MSAGNLASEFLLSARLFVTCQAVAQEARENGSWSFQEGFLEERAGGPNFSQEETGRCP